VQGEAISPMRDSRPAGRTLRIILLLLTALLATVPARGLVVLDVAECFAGLGDDSVLRYDALKFAASLQGLVNRERPQLLLRFLEGPGQGRSINIDDYWLEKMQGGWLKGEAVERVSSLEALLERFPEAGAGVVLWDPEVPATANVAATICGVDGLLPVRAQSALAARLVDGGPRLPIRGSLVGMFTGAESGSRKCDAYLWAMRTYLDTGKCNDRLMAYYIDAYTQAPGKPGFAYHDFANATLTNADYYIARRAFFFDLGPWADEAPVDDPGQPLGTDKRTLEALLSSIHRQNRGEAFTTVGGFTPWNLKYTDHPGAGGKHGGVPTEWEYAAILSSRNALMDADALGISCLTNAAAYMHHPLAEAYKQNPRPAPRALENKTYVLVYMGDYDSSAWLSYHIPSIWDDPVRGEIPIAWAFNPNLSDRVPYVFDHLYKTKTANDWFIAGDSGAGYLNPSLLTGERLGSGFPDALALWEQHNTAYFKRFDYSITGFVINGFHPKMTVETQEAYARFSPDGVGAQWGFTNSLVNGTPFLRHSADVYPDMPGLEKTTEQIGKFLLPWRPQFLIFRMILQKPSTLKAVRDRLVEKYPDANVEFCDPYTFFDLYKKWLESR
jgi:hypothetical protein